MLMASGACFAGEPKFRRSTLYRRLNTSNWEVCYCTGTLFGKPSVRLLLPIPMSRKGGETWGIPLSLFLSNLLQIACPQNSKRNANCMKRGVVSVERYLPNCVGSSDNDG